MVPCDIEVIPQSDPLIGEQQAEEELASRVWEMSG